MPMKWWFTAIIWLFPPTEVYAVKVYIKTYGCQMNERDSEACAGALVARGFEIIDNEHDADVIIFNTCSVRDQAERKAVGKIGIMKRLKREKPDLIIGLMGCMAQNRGDELMEKIPHLDFTIGTGQLHRLTEILEKFIEDRHREIDIREGKEVLTGMGAHYSAKGKNTFAQIAVTRGCNRFCSYCIVPHVRGREISRDPADVVEEARQLVATGAKEIMLLGQNVAAFGLGGDTSPPPADVSPFADLLTNLNAIEGLERIRFTSPYPSYFSDKLINAVGTLPKVCKNIHLPLQSGSDSLLKKMNRQYTAEKYLEIVEKLKTKIPNITFSTDIIVGFPGETEEDFNATREVMNKVAFDNAYIFKYSPRTGTPAAEMKDQVPKEVKEERNQILLADLKARTENHNAAYVGTTVEVLVEGPSKRNAARWSGRTSNAKMTIFDPPENISRGDMVMVKINRSTPVSLFGQIE
jgi:tRNA-2-methylthio-N6-dimethylallyladenosine synthase